LTGNAALRYLIFSAAVAAAKPTQARRAADIARVVAACQRTLGATRFGGTADVNSLLHPVTA
jgi:hypothetical protein